MKSPNTDSILRNLTMLLPEDFRHHLIRRTTPFPTVPFELGEIKVAETKQEYLDAFRLIHDSYVHAKLTDPVPSGFCVFPHQLLRTTAIVIVKDRAGQLLGTLSIVLDGPHGLPLNHQFRFVSLGPPGARQAEIMGVALSPSVRSKHHHLLLALSKYTIRYASRWLGINSLFIALPPERVDLFRALFPLDYISQEIYRDPNLKNSKWVALSCNMDHLESKLRALYRGTPQNRNGYTYLFCHTEPNFRYPPRQYFSAFHSDLPKDLIDELGVDANSMLAAIPSREDRLVCHRTSTRYPVHMSGFLQKGHWKLPLVLHDVSQNGVRAFLTRPQQFSKSATCDLQLHVGNASLTALKARCVWQKNHLLGLEILEETPVWKELHQHLTLSWNCRT